MSGVMRSIPATSSPTTFAAWRAMAALSGWISSVRSIVGAAEGSDAERLQPHEAPRLRDILQGQPLLGQHGVGLLIDGDGLQRLVGLDAAAGIGIGDLDQLGDGVAAIADDVRGDAARRTATT